MMSSGFEITCINKDQRGNIVRVGGADWSLSVSEAIVKIITHQLRLNIFWNGNYVDVEVCGEGQGAYLCIGADKNPLHTIEGIPSC